MKLRKVFGSSPRVWGALNLQALTVQNTRLIPTCVGSTCQGCNFLPKSSAHPHVCGEHQAPQKNRAIGAGSSPRVWGAREDFTVGDTITRLIPTCVGSTRLA